MVLSYRHAFHVGNVGDVLKHITLLSLLKRAAAASSRPLVYVDTHSGAGLYKPTTAAHPTNPSLPAPKPPGYLSGVAKLLNAASATETEGQAATLPALVTEYLALLRSLNEKHGSLSTDPSSTWPFGLLPGSPLLASSVLRPLDRLVLCELHSSDAPLLQQALASDLRAMVHATDGFRVLTEQVPPAEGRAVALIDPPYEHASEYGRACASLRKARLAFPLGHYALWLPILTSHGHKAKGIARAPADKAGGKGKGKDKGDADRDISPEERLQGVYREIAQLDVDALPAEQFSAKEEEVKSRQRGKAKAKEGGGERHWKRFPDYGQGGVLLAELGQRPLRQHHGSSGGKSNRMIGSAMVLCNPPLGVHEDLLRTLPFLAEALYPEGSAICDVRWIASPVLDSAGKPFGATAGDAAPATGRRSERGKVMA